MLIHAACSVSFRSPFSWNRFAIQKTRVRLHHGLGQSIPRRSRELTSWESTGFHPMPQWCNVEAINRKCGSPMLNMHPGISKSLVLGYMHEEVIGSTAKSDDVLSSTGRIISCGTIITIHSVEQNHFFQSQLRLRSARSMGRVSPPRLHSKAVEETWRWMPSAK